MDDPKQHVIDTLKGANNILVTVRSSPSIDQLAACIALTLVLNALGKHGTAVFSGQIPSVLEFLEPEKTIEKNTDSLQDFIISLDKAKADKLRYKVEDDVVRIFITPYKTSISDRDLEFGQGDFNVDVVVALGVHIQDDLDEAITAHGRILHDATVISMNTEGGVSEDLGSINWIDMNVSSLSEMVATLVDQLGKEDAVDNQVATALLTGIVAETERFGNAKTKPATMEVAAKLLAAGANQELVATKLSEPSQPQASLDQDGASSDDSSFIESLVPKDDGGTLEIEHLANEEVDDPPLQAGLAPESDTQEQPPVEQSEGQTGGAVPPVLNFDQPASESQSSDQPQLPASAEPRPQSEEAAALDYLQSRKVEVDRRPRIEPLRGHGEYLGESGGEAPNASDAVGADGEAATDKPDNSHFALTPPTMGGTLTANMPQDQAATPTISKHGAASPILSHGKSNAVAPDDLIEPVVDASKPEAEAEKSEEAAEPELARVPAAEIVRPEHSDTSEAKPTEETPAESTDSLITPAFDIQASAPAEPAADKPQSADAAPQTLADLEREVRKTHAELTGAADMPKPAAPTVNLPSPQPAPAAPVGSGPASPPPPVPPPLPPLPNAAS